MKFRVERERGNLDVVNEFLQAGHARQLDRLFKRTICPKRAFRNSDEDLVLHRSDAANAFRLELGNQAIFLAFEVQSFRRNLFQMNFHARNLSIQALNFFAKALATTAGTNLDTSPPSRAISFTNREL